MRWAGWSGVYRIPFDWREPPRQVLSGGALIGLGVRSPWRARSRRRPYTAYRLSVPVRGLISSVPGLTLMNQLFARKPISELLAESHQSLKRVLGAGDLIMLALAR